MKKIEETVERRFLVVNTEIRAAEAKGESRTIIGSAVVFDSITDMRWFKEKIDSAAFDEILADPNHDVVALVNHDTNLVVARRSAGTLKLYKEGNKLMYEFDAPKTTAGNDLLENVRSGNIKGSSFQFEVAEQKWTFDDKDDRNDLRTVLKVSRLWDVGPVVFPAYVDTSVAQRSRPERPKPFDETALRSRERDLEMKSKLV
jgi:HK97 family phage prohead protease